MKGKDGCTNDGHLDKLRKKLLGIIGGEKPKLINDPDKMKERCRMLSLAGGLKQDEIEQNQKNY